jgi:hypothetical protein
VINFLAFLLVGGPISGALSWRQGQTRHPQP